MANQILPQLSDRDIQRFLSKIKIIGADECWEWTGGAQASGYGFFSHGAGRSAGSKVFCSHRVAYLIFRGNDPGELFVCHKCDNRLCQNPKHLFLGTKADNTRDMIEKKRHKFGEDSPRAKLNEAKVLALRRGSTLTQREIADALGVSQSAVSMALNGITWGHVT